MVKLKEFFIYHGHLYNAKVVHGFLINTIGFSKRGFLINMEVHMRKQNKEYLFDLLQERLSLLDERTEQEWEDAADPKGQEMIILAETIGYLNDLLD